MVKAYTTAAFYKNFPIQADCCGTSILNVRTASNGLGVALILRPQCTVRLGNRTTFSGITTVRL